MKKTKVIRTSTSAISLDYLLKGQLEFLNNYYDVVAVSGADIHLANISLREGVRVIDVRMDRAISPFKDLISLWNLYYLFCREKPKIVHSITPKAGLLTMTAAYFAGVPIRIHTFTGLIFPSKTGFLKQLLIALDKVLCYYATNIYPEGQGVKNDLIKYNITSKNLKVLANGNINGIDLELFNPVLFSEQENHVLKSTLGISLDDFVFIFVGRLVRDKGINELIDAFLKLSFDMMFVKLLLVGDFEDHLDPLSPKTKLEISVNRKIILVGFQKDVRPYLAISDCLAFPSYREGFPNVVLEAGAMGLPCIVSDINGSNEIILDGENGIIISHKDAAALFLSMKKIIKAENERIRMQQKARQMIVLRYEQNMVWGATLAEYMRLERLIQILQK